MKFEKEFKSGETDYVFNIAGHTSDALIKAIVYDQDDKEVNSIVCDSNSYKGGISEIKIPQGHKCKI
jgi:hypothetical protein